MSYENSDDSQIDPLPEKFDIVYGRQIEYHSIPHKISKDENLSLSCEPHPMIVLMIVSNKDDDEVNGNHEDNEEGQEIDEEDEVFYVVGVFGQTVRKDKFDYYDVAENDLVLKKNDKNNLSDTTIFRFHAKNINVLKYNKYFFEKKRGKYLIGGLEDSEIDSIRDIFKKFPQVQKIISYIIDENIQILPLGLHKKEEYKLVFTTKKEKISK